MLSIQPSVGVVWVRIPQGVDSEVSRVRTFHAGINVGVKLPYQLIFNAMARYNSGALSLGSTSQSAIVQGLAIGLPQLLTEVSATKTILNDKMTLSVRVTDPFNVQQNGFKVYSDSMQRTSIYKMATRFLYFSLSYRFNSFKRSMHRYDDGGIKLF